MGWTKRPGKRRARVGAPLGEFLGQADEATFAVCRTGGGPPKARSGPPRGRFRRQSAMASPSLPDQNWSDSCTPTTSALLTLDLPLGWTMYWMSGWMVSHGVTTSAYVHSSVNS